MREEQLIQTPGAFGENGNFLLERELGRGGMGGVYMGRDKMLDRPVAVKVMLKEYGSDPEFVDKFKREAQAVARLIHPNIAQVYSYGIANGMPYIAMELVAGGSLDGLMKVHGASIEVPRVMKICEQVAQALRCAADQGLVHGDVKPENILLDSNGNAKLVDFGLAAMQKDTDEIWGTPYYIAPEKVRKQPVDYRADMYSLGGTIYHALTGSAPFEGDDATEVVKKRFLGLPKKPSELRPGISPQIDRLVMTMLAVDPKDRHPSFEALLEDFKNVMTVGLGFTQPLPDTAVKSASSTTTKSIGGKKRLKLATRRVASSTTTISNDAASNGGESGGDAGAPAPVKKSGAPGYIEEAPETGSVGGKIALFVGIIVLVIVGVVGSLVYVMGAKERGKNEEFQRSVSSNIQKAKINLKMTRDAAKTFMDDMADRAALAEKACIEPTEKMRELLSERYSDTVVAMLKPAPTQELLDAIASTNENAVVAAPAPAPAPAADAAAAKPAEAKEAIDPASPEGQAAAESANAEGGAEATPAPAEEQAPKQSDEIPDAVKDINGIWERAYGCRAAEIRVHKQLEELLAKIERLMGIDATDEATLKKLADAAADCKTDFDTIKASKDIETIGKSRNTIESRGAKAVERMARRLNELKLQEERERKKREEAEAESNRLAKAAADKAALIESETAAAKAAFEKINRNLVQLDWKSAKRTLEYETGTFTSAEGQLEAQRQIDRVEAMESVTVILAKNIKGFTFSTGANTKGKKNLRGCKIVSTSETGFTYLRGNSTKEQKITWFNLYRDYHVNLNELINKFIKRGRQNCVPKLNNKQWSEAMLGVALTMQIVCADEPSAAVYGVQLAKEAVKGFPSCLKQAKEFFPDIDFSEVAAEVEAGQL